jgi:ornithine carbamoyltransferase
MAEQTLEEKLHELAGLKFDLCDRDFLLTWEHSLAEIRAILLAAECLRTLYGAGRSLRLFDTGLAVSIFRDQSTRTRFSFASAASALGLTLADFDETKSQIAHGETVRETAVMIAFAPGLVFTSSFAAARKAAVIAP